MFVQHNQVHSKDLEASAKKVAKSLNLDLEVIQTSLKSNSSETEMRDERYKHLLSNLKKDEVLLTGHNLSDKAETLLINLFRGTRLEGLKSINSENSLSSKPMINISQKKKFMNTLMKMTYLIAKTQQITITILLEIGLEIF